MAKLLRLDVAQLTDVGRKREHNEDNMAYVIPKDLQVMTRKGALFIVADGMGGHAAGEVASEIAVDTVSNAYYQDESDDIPNSLLQAIRRANAAIHQRAAENMLRSGMGTTCVAAVLRGNQAYIANVGDSRAYFIRKSRIYQISQDHSWVAEQVRAGLLTEEQARTHAQRNVITRSLGTQPDVEIDIFREVLEEGDTLILCSDGLSGLVNDDDLLHTVDQFVPQESVYHLVERANENGGPDNITAIVARVQEVGLEAANVRQPVPVPIGGSELSNEDTARLFAPPVVGLNQPLRNGNLLAPASGSTFPYGSSSLISSESDTAPQPVLQTRRRQGRLFYPTLFMLLLLILVAGSGGGYYLLHINQSQTINQTLNNATALIGQASGETVHNPVQALHDLASAQQKLQDLKQHYSLSASVTTQLTNLQNQLVSATKSAIIQYNQSGLITLLPCTNSAPTNSLSASPATSLAVINANNTPLTYTLGQDGQIYQLIQSSANQYTLTSAFAPANTLILSIIGIKNQLFALSQQMTNGTVSNHTLYLLNPGPHGNLQIGKSTSFDAAHLASGQTPTLLTAWSDGTNTVLYVVITSSSTQNSATILAYTVDAKGLSAPIASPISVSERIVSLAAASNQLFFVEADGSMWNAAISTDHKISTVAQVLVNQPIATPLASDPQQFTVNNNVPTATATTTKGTMPLTFPFSQNASTLLSAAMVKGVDGVPHYHLFIGDPTNHRVLDLTQLPAPGGPVQAPTSTPANSSQSLTLTLVQQYVSHTYFTTIKGLAIDANVTLTILGQLANANEDLVVINGAQKSCAS
ncbi:MAG TPA: Stp1/IreP family PP2C-type Ser/Thr phosphatase [Ktedonobacteraceae bacterium]